VDGIAARFIIFSPEINLFHVRSKIRKEYAKDKRFAQAISINYTFNSINEVFTP
jgi:hypothetical protein